MGRSSPTIAKLKIISHYGKVDTKQEYLAKRREAQKLLLLARNNKEQVSLKSKSTTHFFRKRIKKNTLDLRNFNKVIQVDTKRMVAEVEGLTAIEDLCKETLKYNLIPQIVPDLKRITVGGAISGLGDESSGHRYGVFHETISEFDLLTSQGKVLRCSAHKNQKLFRAVPNSLGTLGYILKCKVRLQRAKAFVRLFVVRFNHASDYFSHMKREINEGQWEFIDGIVFSPREYVVCLGEFIDEVPNTETLFDPVGSVFYKALEDKKIQTLYFTTDNYLWRWDTDVFWSTDRGNMLTSVLQNNTMRKYFGKYFLGSSKLIHLRNIFERIDSELLNKLFIFNMSSSEQLIQDIGIEIDKCSKFLFWYQKVINIYPLWVCPIKAVHSYGYYPLYHWRGKIIVDIGFYSAKELKPGMSPHHYNRLVEQKLLEFKGLKGQHMTSFYEEKEFWKIYDKDEYFKVKSKVDPTNTFPNIFQKTVGERTL